jgi:hypothetical protein
MHDAEPVTGALEARDRLPHLPDGAALQPERPRPDHRLVSDLDGAQPQGAHDRQQVAAHAQQSQTPASRMADAAELLQQRLHLASLTDRIPADERTAADDAVGEKAASRR